MEITDYEKLLGDLLPYGPAWERDYPLLTGLAPSLWQLHQRADRLMSEIDPRSVTELINRYEALCGLPDSCTPNRPLPLTERRQRLDAKINILGGITKQFYLAQLAALGYPDATITQYQASPFRCTYLCTDRVYSQEWLFYWQVNMPSATNLKTMNCLTSCMAHLRSWGDRTVECVIKKLCASHTVVIFHYPHD